ncbi:hypothetical protein [Bacillus mycoides]|uniref:hypothetical protein n=1 Tax=Bacillus mycoides TaxID=1405 RepID=UPI001F12D0B7|nr:hypothetical protein [Bacillus mycoides]
MSEKLLQPDRLTKKNQYVKRLGKIKRTMETTKLVMQNKLSAENNRNGVIKSDSKGLRVS